MGKYTIRLTGFQPDFFSSNLNTGRLSGFGIIPTLNGYSYPHGREIHTSNSSFTGATAISTNLLFAKDNTPYFYVSDTTSVFRASGSSYTSIGSMSATKNLAHNFAQFGNLVFVSSPSAALRYATTTGSFSLSAVSGGPTVAFIETVNQFLFAARTSTSSTQWICSALGNPLDWAPSVTTQCATGELHSGTGPITSLKRLGDNIVIYKERSMFLGRYVGAQNNTWAFEQVSGNIGTIANKAVADIDYAHVFVGQDDFYLFDGTRPIALHCPAREFFKNDQSYKIFWSERSRVQHVVDRNKKLIYWFYPSESFAGIASLALVFNYERNPSSEAWGFINIGADGGTGPFANVVGMFSPGTTNNPYPVFIDYQNKLRYLHGTTGTASGTWNISPIGDIENFITMKRVRPLFRQATGRLGNDYVASLVVRNDNSEDSGISGAGFTARTFVGASSGNVAYLDTLDSGRIFNITITKTGTAISTPAEISALVIDFDEDGTE